MNIKELRHRAHQQSKDKGFHDGPLTDTKLMHLILGEAYEAFEAIRSDKRTDKIILGALQEDFYTPSFKQNIKDTFEDEIADVAIRMLDYLGFKDIAEFDDAKFERRYIFKGEDFDYCLSELFLFFVPSVQVFKIKDSLAYKVLNWCVTVAKNFDFDLETHILLKLDYNLTRPYKHGKQF